MDKVTGQCPQTTTFLKRRAEAVSNRGPSAYQPNALPLGQTGSRRQMLVEVLLYVHRNRRFIRDGNPGRPPRLSHGSRALTPPDLKSSHYILYKTDRELVQNITAEELNLCQ